MNRSILKRATVFVGLLLMLAIGGFVLWASLPTGPMPEAMTAIQSDSQVQVSTERWLEFAPAQGASQVGFIFYPGGRVDARAYAPLAHDIAAAGFRVIIVPMPLNLAVFGSGRAADVI
ncbi:MAG: alpha/beta hydrolase, partial [Anaerolineae bacterium]|nr:alpha/beta hydrolase [Anaerolineae bacterium]